MTPRSAAERGPGQPRTKAGLALYLAGVLQDDVAGARVLPDILAIEAEAGVNAVERMGPKIRRDERKRRAEMKWLRATRFLLDVALFLLALMLPFAAWALIGWAGYVGAGDPGLGAGLVLGFVWIVLYGAAWADMHDHGNLP